MRGPEVAERVRRLCPGIPVIMMSGYDSGHAGRQAAQETDSVLLNKVFAPSAMLRVVRSMLDAKAPADPTPSPQPQDPGEANEGSKGPL